VVFAVVFAWVLLGQSLGPWQLVGAALVVAGIALVRVDEQRRAPADAELPPPAAVHAAGPLPG
jgi:drug/metabolite transporter (DMT)-like permease